MKKIIQKILTCIRENASLKQASKQARKQASKQASKQESKKGGNGLTHCFQKGVALC